MTNTINTTTLELVKSFEGLSLEVYHGKQDPDDVFTIGYGHTAGVTRYMPPITQEQADDYLRQDLSHAEREVKNAITTELNDNQYGALCSLVYNCGVLPLSGTLGCALNAGDFAIASDAFLLWDKVHINDVLTVSQGLLNRRLAEQKLFNAPMDTV